MINQQRIADEFFRLASIDSPSYREASIAAYLHQRFSQLGATVEVDTAGATIGSDSGNMIARFPGTRAGDPFVISVHMDTVSPAENVQPVLNDGIFTSAGNTILGADDKAGIAELIEAIEVLNQQNIPYGPLEVVITVCEELGLLGAKAFDFSVLKGKRGVALDTTGIDRIITRAPAANRMKIDIYGLEAHAGVCPEQGISAITIAAKAIARMTLGRIDEHTTANIGTINGGVATNIIPGQVSLRGEVRSHAPERLQQVTEAIIRCFEEEAYNSSVVVDGKTRSASMAIEIQEDFPAMQIAETAPIVQLIVNAGKTLQRPQQIAAAGGGSDANIFNGHGIDMVILGTGMAKVHTPQEQVAVADMEKVSSLLVEIIRNA
ncbi:M20/M25/M40 family metallo-hydrolase [Pelovirga terrestris]|uniref:M20/M25/M40 family metallo-hydrolase n=1 Tax=Pelovirga terrestris TaxID=2771352 RepID=A0A8J6QTP3_9BACT|nr:M20/M25/M40 family metallo-hydrolase [Pelovirga terrestris]MBD1399470.1 M20/M25/M40 family metallo-hydrolase [Pelovirga terrestris]